MYHLFVWMMNTINAWGYLGIIVLMALESSIVPVPSELIIPPAAYWASQGNYSLAGIILCGTFGSWLGAALSYWVSSLVGRPLVVRYGRYVLIPESKLQTAEAWVHTYGTGGIFLSRLLPVVRHLISIPAGICRMNFLRFSLMTILGSAVWCSTLAWFGPRVITPAMLQDPESMLTAVKGQMHYIALLMIVVTVLWALMQYLTRPKK